MSNITAFLKRTFCNGMEGWDPSEKKPDNLGGAKVWGIFGQNPTAKFNVELPAGVALKQVTKDLNALMFTVNHAALGEDGKAETRILANGQKGYRRVDWGLILYVRGVNASEAKKRIVEAIPDIEKIEAICTGREALDGAPEVQHLFDKPLIRGMSSGSYNCMDPDHTIFLDLRAGSPEDGCLWQTVRRQARTAEELVQGGPEQYGGNEKIPF